MNLVGSGYDLGDDDYESPSLLIMMTSFLKHNIVVINVNIDVIHLAYQNL